MQVVGPRKSLCSVMEGADRLCRPPLAAKGQLVHLHGALLLLACQDADAAALCAALCCVQGECAAGGRAGAVVCAAARLVLLLDATTAL